MAKPMKIFTSTLSKPTRYYASTSYRIDGNKVTITGKKWDVSEDVESIIQYAMEQRETLEREMRHG